MTTPKDVLVTWVSVNHGAAPLLDALEHPRSLLRGKIGRMYLCYRSGPEEDPGSQREKDAMSETTRDLRGELAPICPDIVRCAWKTKAPPTDHAAIRPFAEEVLLRAREENPDATIYVHVSPGTPAMHAVWLVLVSTGLVSGDVHLVQGVGGRDRPKTDPPIALLRFQLDSWLRRYRRQRPVKVVDHDDGQLWDPSRARSRGLREAMSKLERWAPARVPVLMVGERGTGKTTLASQLRARSPFQKQGGDSWTYQVVCGQFRVNPQLARSELFGHKKGAFTGATSDRKGLLAQADGDTIFLDEIGDIDQDTQRLLMAALEGRGFSRLGDSRVIQSRFRLVCATNRPLADLRGKVIDEDFFDRVAVFVLQVPPLRACREDLPQIWRSVLAGAVVTAELAPEGWEQLRGHPAVLEALADLPLYGNLRDLQRLAFHGLAALEAEATVEEAVAEGIRALESSASSDGAGSEQERRWSLPLEDGLAAELARVEAGWLEAAMHQAGDNQSEAARLLGMKRRTFADRLSKVRSGG